MTIDSALEERTRASIALDEPLGLLARFKDLTRESGTPDERAAAEYVIERLEALGVPVTVHEPPLYLSNPERAELHVSVAEGGQMVTARPPAFSLSTGGAELSGEICYVPSSYAGGTASLFDTAAAARGGTDGHDPVAGRIVLTEGFSMPGNVAAFERRGAIGQIYVHPGRDIHEGICTSIWGTPTADSIGRKPRTPVVCVNRGDGSAMAARAQREPMRATIRTWLREGWFPCLLPVVDIRGTEDPLEFLLVHGHYDSWYVGIGDNATGDAALLELARLFHGARGALKRSLRIAWWPGHSTGRYAGSTWYADTFADELDECCIAQLNIDSPGCAGATNYDEVMWMAEAAGLCQGAVRDALGQEARGMRPLRAGDYSFNQIGPTGFYMLLSNIPAAERQARGFYAVGGCGGNIAWHTPHDLTDVFDAEILRRDLAVYVTTILRVLNAPLHPFDYRATVAEIREAVARYRDAAGDLVRLDSVDDDLARVGKELDGWYARAASSLAEAPGDTSRRRALNATLRRVARILVPLNFARGERFDHDPALKLPAVPRLEAATRLASAPEALKPFLVAGLLRERNKIRAMLRQVSRDIAG
jgi:hypothetical protein